MNFYAYEANHIHVDVEPIIKTKKEVISKSQSKNIEFEEVCNGLWRWLSKRMR